MLKIYIGKNYNGEPTSVLLAENREKADITWMGMKDAPHSVDEIDPSDDTLGMHGVVILLTSEEKTVDFTSRFEDRPKFRKFKRGL